MRLAAKNASLVFLDKPNEYRQDKTTNKKNIHSQIFEN